MSFTSLRAGARFNFPTNLKIFQPNALIKSRKISWDGIIRDNVAFGIRGAGHGDYGAGSVISDSSNTISERNVFIGGDDGASILSGSRSGEGRPGWTSRDSRVIENVLMWWTISD
jgi:hypothetical protein